jgi:hypothetical protein
MAGVACKHVYNQIDFLSPMTRGPRPRSSPFGFRRDFRWSHATAVAPFPTQSIRSTGLHLVRWNGSHTELHRLQPEWLHSEQSCFCQKNGKLAALPAPALRKLDPFVRILPSLRSTLTKRAFSTTLRGLELGVVPFSPYAQQPRDDARVLP